MIAQVDRFHYHGHSEPEPLGLEYIAAALSHAGYDISFRSRFELEVTDSSSGANMSFFSSITPEWHELILHAENAKRRGNITIAGGYHVCGTPESINEKCFDYAVVGEGENISVELANSIFKHSEDIVPTSNNGTHLLKASQIDNLDDLANPVRNEHFLHNYKIYDLMWPPASKQNNAALVLASRGCRFSCEFCASATVWGKGIRLRKVENIVQELINLKTNFGTNTVVFIDQSLGQAKKWTLELCDAIKSAELGMKWYHQSNLDIDRDVLAAMAAAGCTKIGFGLEGISPAAIQNIKQQIPYDFDEANRLFDYCNSLRIFVKVYLMLGYPWETEDVINEYFENIQNLRANEIKISFFTPFPGTKAWQRYSDNLVSSDWKDFDTVSMPVVYNPNISVAKYLSIRTKLFRAYYGSKTYFEVTRQLLERFPYYADSYREFINYLRQYEMITGGEEWIALVKDA